MKSLRKSLNGNKDNIRSQISTPLPSISRPPASILPPQKVIRALQAYRSQAPQELSFQKGDFFYVLQDVDSQGAWYEAHNPVTGARGLVPRSMFEEFGKKSTPIRTSQAGLPPKSLQSVRTDPATPSTPKTQVFYAVVLHDFEAERPDELDAKRGDPISVVAQSNREWFVAKPIGRLGRPGLIPVSFVEIRDPATGIAIADVDGLMDRGELPKVEDWKRAMLNYKQNSITLGVIDSPTRGSVPNSPFVSKSPKEPTIIVQGPSPNKASHSPTVPPEPLEPELLPDGILLSANVSSFHFEMEEYWFRVDAIFQPYGPQDLDTLPSAKQLVLFRVYNDFYDFQVSLLGSFPREAGREPPHPRLLPYMPGPADHVDHGVTVTRRKELNEYLKNLCSLKSTGARYILEHPVIREFLALKPGDLQSDIEPQTAELQPIYVHDPYDDGAPEESSKIEYDSEVRDTLGRLKVQDRGYEDKSDGSEYEDEGYAPSPQHKTHDHPYGQQQWEEHRPSHPEGSHSLPQHAPPQNHQRTDSTASFQRTSSPYSWHSRSNSPLPNNNNVGNGASYRSTSTSSLRSSQAPSVASRSRSHSTATSNLNAPAISAANPQTAFIKIKIFDRLADDLIAIRVHPKVTHAELLEKVQSRLGGDVAYLRYRDSLSSEFVNIDGDADLRAWIEQADKHVLYAD